MLGEPGPAAVRDPMGLECDLDAMIEKSRRDLHALAGQLLRGERVDHTLQPTALVSEMWVRLLVRDDVEFATPSAFWAWASTTMRRILVDYARMRLATKRGGGRQAQSWGTMPEIPVQAGVDLVELDDALHRLERAHPRSASVVEMRFFGGMTEAMIAQRLGVSERTVRSDWRMARVWLHRELGEGQDQDGANEAARGLNGDASGLTGARGASAGGCEQ